MLDIASEQNVYFRQHVGQRRGQDDASSEAGDGGDEELTIFRLFCFRLFFFVVVRVEAPLLDEQRQQSGDDRDHTENGHRQQLGAQDIHPQLGLKVRR